MYVYSIRVSSRQAYSHLEEVRISRVKKHPTAVSSRASTKFVIEEPVKILMGSNMFLKVLEGHVRSYVQANGMATTTQRSKSNQPTISSADDESAAAEEEKRR